MQPAFLHSFVTRSHKGVYGIMQKNNQILLIRKARGPYTGLYDLPGGSPEAAETYEQAALRELSEEMGIKAHEMTFVGKEYKLRDGKPRVFHHAFKVISDDQITFDPSEVAEVHEFQIPELRQKITDHPEQFKDIFAKIFMKTFK